MNLVVFDLDGTLTQTFAVDGQYFVQALGIGFNVGLVNPNWAEYRDVTDYGVTLELCRGKYGRDAESAEIHRSIECFVSLLTEAHFTNRNSFGEIPGVAIFLNRLRQHRDWRAAIATGGWEQCARFKMTAAGIEEDGIPAAFAEDGPSREGIVQAAIARAGAAYGTATFEKTVLVGDAIWDVRTAQRLGLPFIGIGSGEEAALLRNAGASDVVENFLDHEYCMECFERAEIPMPHGRPISGQG